MSGKACLLIILLLLALLLGGCYAPPDTVAVIKVIDGDTIVIEGGYRVRYIGIDTPEIRPREEAYAIEAWQANRQMVEGKRVRLEKDVSETDRYDRLLRYVYVASSSMPNWSGWDWPVSSAILLIPDINRCWKKWRRKPDVPGGVYGADSLIKLVMLQ